MQNEKHVVLIAGGSGLIGRRLTQLLTADGIEVRHLSRKINPKSSVPTYVWDPSEHSVDDAAFKDVTAVINLAGTPIAEKKWTAEVKKDILQSRLDSVHTLLDACKRHDSVKCIIGASAIGYYGDRNDELLTETAEAGKGFLADTVTAWEESYNGAAIRNVLLRTGIVLSRRGGALPPLAKPVEIGIAPVTGNQYMSWMHIDDVCGMYIKALNDNNWKGVYNATAPSPVRGREFVKILQKILNPFSLRIPVPSFMLKLMLGEQSHLILDSANVSSTKAVEAGYVFKYTGASSAIKHLYGK